MVNKKKLMIACLASIPIIVAIYLITLQHPGSGQDIVIKDSGSTNTCSLTLTVYSNGAGRADACLNHDSQAQAHPAFGRGFFDRNALDQALLPYPDVSLIPAAANRCSKSASFGSTITVASKGKESPDLTCLTSQDTKLQVLIKAVSDAEDKALGTD